MRTFALAGAVTVLLVPGSGWRGVDVYDGESMATGQSTWRGWGFRAKVVSYGPGQTGRQDVADALAAERRRRPRARICLYGESSGGTWALLAAANVPGGADCVAVAGAPTDEDTWRRSKRRVARSFAHRIWPAFFGTGAADDLFEPLDVWRAMRPSVPAFSVVASNDPTVPPQQGRVFQRSAPGSKLRVLPAGRWPFVHSEVGERALRRMRSELRRFVRSG